MALFFPSIEQINKFKVPPTEGERALLTFLGNTLDDSFEVYFNPYMNGDRPDVVILRKNYGVPLLSLRICKGDMTKIEKIRDRLSLIS